MTTYYTQAHHMMEVMLEWYIGSMTDYSVSCGKLNKYFKRYLPEDYEHGFLKYMEIVGAGSTSINIWSREPILLKSKSSLSKISISGVLYEQRKSIQDGNFPKFILF